MAAAAETVARLEVIRDWLLMLSINSFLFKLNEAYR